MSDPIPVNRHEMTDKPDFDLSDLSKSQLREFKLAQKLVKRANGDRQWLDEMAGRQDNKAVVGWIYDIWGADLARREREANAAQIGALKDAEDTEVPSLRKPGHIDGLKHPKGAEINTGPDLNEVRDIVKDAFRPKGRSAKIMIEKIVIEFPL